MNGMATKLTVGMSMITEDVAHSLLRKASASILLHTGFSSSSEGASSVITDLIVDFFGTFGNLCRQNFDKVGNVGGKKGNFFFSSLLQMREMLFC